MKKIITILLLIISAEMYSQGPQMLNDNSFSQTPSPWTYNSRWDLSGGTASFDGAGVASELIQTDANMALSMEPNSTYTFSVDITTSGEAKFAINSYLGKKTLSSGRFTIEFVSPSTISVDGFRLIGYADSDPFELDNISLIKNDAVGDSPYYVATDGNDIASGDIDNPWATWEKAARVAQAGDTIYFRGGTYYLTESVSIYDASEFLVGRDTTHSGTYGNKVCYFGYPPDKANGDSVIFDFSGNYIREPDVDAMDSLYALGESTSGMGSNNSGITFGYVNYFHFKDFTIRNVYQKYRYTVATGLSLNGSRNYTLENLTVHTIGGHGIGAGTPYGIDSTYIINCDVYRCIDSLSASPSNFDNGWAGTWGVGIFMVPSFSNQYMEITGCRVWDNADDGMNIVPFGRAIITNTWSFENGVYIDDIGDGVTSYITSGNAYKLNSPTSALERLSGQDTINHYVRNSIAAFNLGVAYKDNHFSGTPTLGRLYYNNIAYHNGDGIINTNECGAEPCKPTEVYNHIGINPSANAEAYVVRGAIINDSYNSWNTPPGVTVTADDFLYGLDSLTISNMLKAPRNADGSLPTNPFTLKEGSDLIDAGKDVGLPYNGSKPDLGPIEYQYQPGTDNRYPSVEIITPSDGSTFEKKNSLTISIEATDDGGISKLELYNSDTLLEATSYSTFTYHWDNPPNGKFSFRAIAADDKGAKATSSLVSVIIDSEGSIVPVIQDCFEAIIKGNIVVDSLTLEFPKGLPVDTKLSIVSKNATIPIILDLDKTNTRIEYSINVSSLAGKQYYFLKFDNSEGLQPCKPFEAAIYKK